MEKVLDHDDDADNERTYKVKWIGYEIPTWEPETFLRNSKQLIDACFQESGKDRTRPRRLSKRTWKRRSLS